MAKKATTIKIDQELFKAAKKHAVDMELTLSEVIERALKRELKIK